MDVYETGNIIISLIFLTSMEKIIQWLDSLDFLTWKDKNTGNPILLGWFKGYNLISKGVAIGLYKILHQSTKQAFFTASLWRMKFLFQKNLFKKRLRASRKNPSRIMLIQFLLVVSTHLKNISQTGSFPQVGVKIKNIWNHQVELARQFRCLFLLLLLLLLCFFPWAWS